jgi:hypothetical protein
VRKTNNKEAKVFQLYEVSKGEEGMNVERMKQVRAWVAMMPDQFCDMTDWQHLAWDKDSDGIVTFEIMQQRGFLCGSAACIAGITELMVNRCTRRQREKMELDGQYVWAQDWLELSYFEKKALFCSMPSDSPQEGWKAWMLQRLDDAIASGVITEWHDEEEEEYNEDEPEEELTEDE